MTALLLVALVAGVLCWPRPRSARARLRALTGPAAPTAQSAPQLRRPVVLAAALAVAAVVVDGGSWWFVALLVAAGVMAGRTRPRIASSPQDVALAADLMAACLLGGASIADALAAATASAGHVLREQAMVVVDELRRGAPPEHAWVCWLADEQLAPVARSCARSGGSGAAVAAELTRVAARIRARHRALAQERAARASVWVVLPLGLCFLPAFVVVGVVPLVIGLLHSLH